MRVTCGCRLQYTTHVLISVLNFSASEEFSIAQMSKSNIMSVKMNIVDVVYINKFT